MNRLVEHIFPIVKRAQESLTLDDRYAVQKPRRVLAFKLRSQRQSDLLYRRLLVRLLQAIDKRPAPKRGLAMIVQNLGIGFSRWISMGRVRSIVSPFV